MMRFEHTYVLSIRKWERQRLGGTIKCRKFESDSFDQLKGLFVDGGTRQSYTTENLSLHSDLAVLLNRRSNILNISHHRVGNTVLAR